MDAQQFGTLFGPYMAPDGSIAYHESIVKKLPPTPKRKDKL